MNISTLVIIRTYVHSVSSRTCYYVYNYTHFKDATLISAPLVIPMDVCSSKVPLYHNLRSIYVLTYRCIETDRNVKFVNAELLC